MSEDVERVDSFLKRNKLTGVALSMVLEAAILGTIGAWWVRGELADLTNTMAMQAKDIAALASRVEDNESATNKVEDKVLRELKEIRSEFKSGIERIEDRMDRRGMP
jgi:hypothetical protein